MPDICDPCLNIGIPTGVGNTPVVCMNGQLVVQTAAPISPCALPYPRPIGSARLDSVGAPSAMNTAPVPLTPGTNVNPLDPAVQRWQYPSQDLNWTNTFGCDVGIMIGYDMGFDIDIDAMNAGYRIGMVAEASVNAGPMQVHAAVYCNTSRISSITTPGSPFTTSAVQLQTLGMGSANPLGDPANETLPFVVVPAGGTLDVHVWAYHFLYAGGLPTPNDSLLLYASAARVYAVPGWV